MTLLQRASYKTFFALATLAPVTKAFAQFGGPIPEIPGTPDDNVDIRGVILNVITFVLDFLALAAVVFIIIAGIRLIVSQGNDDAKDKAKKTIISVIVGLLVVLFARVIVGFFTQTVPAELGAIIPFIS